MRKKVIKFSKSYKNIFNIKKDFYKNNSENLNNVLKINNLYKKQPLRKNCKNCNSKNLKSFIKNFGIKYKICNNCNHVNGEYQDTKKFAESVYFNKRGKGYAKNYLKDYEERVRNIYLPKVNFLTSVIKSKINLIDIGCGGGHFIKALEDKNINATGYEVSKKLCDLGKTKLKKNKIINVNLDDSYKIVRESKNTDVMSMIGVLEHLVDPIKMLEAFQKSKIKYLYILVPMFSLSSFLENSFTKIFPRSLSGAHTHAYTENSINFLAKKFKLKIIGEYWFGTDIPDLYRSLLCSGKILNRKIYQKEIKNKLVDLIDDLQKVLDKKKVCSEAHIIFKKKN
jgi:2-polyprenyl-3-methyl-5-hydroxy-6-metoxy-1,4-benzoquinol methylase